MDKDEDVKGDGNGNEYLKMLNVGFKDCMRKIKIGVTEPCPGLHDCSCVGKTTNGSENSCHEHTLIHFQCNATFLLILNLSFEAKYQQLQRHFSPLNFGKVSPWNYCGRLIVDPNL